ncbi:MAG: HlyD family type I secretion periplasmic adaptor subunit [Rhodoferax sp.]|nr:HlyD family type I secretion periplasmic adaptor subunit [Rhodoferax sp.]
MKNEKQVSLNQFGSAALALQMRPPFWVMRMVSIGICFMTLIAIVFACLAEMDVVVTAQGKVIPAGKSKVVQSLETGVVRSIFVRDGQQVKAGDILLQLDPTSTGADRSRLQREYWEGEAEVARASALLGGRTELAKIPGMPADITLNQTAILQSRLLEQRAKLAGLDADIGKRGADADAIGSSLEQLRSSLPLIQQKHAMREELAKTGHIARTSVLETQMELMNAQKEQAVQGNRLKESKASQQAALEQRAQAEAEFRSRISSELMEATRKRDATRQELVKANQRLELQTLKAPIDGTVQQLAVTTVGGVVTAAQPLLTVVPTDSALELEAQVLNRDIGHVRVGQRVINKVETYDFTRYGYIEGEVQWVGTDAVQDQKLGLVYPIRVKLAQMQTPNRVNGNPGLVAAGMNITADIRADQRRLIEYFIAPLLRYKQEALRER